MEGEDRKGGGREEEPGIGRAWVCLGSTAYNLTNGGICGSISAS